MYKPYHTSSYKARQAMPTIPTGHPTIEASESELTAIFRPTSPRRRLDADLRHSKIHRGEPCDAAGRTFDTCRTLIITRNNRPVAEATISHITPFAHFTRVHFYAPRPLHTQNQKPQIAK